MSVIPHAEGKTASSQACRTVPRQGHDFDLAGKIVHKQGKETQMEAIVFFVVWLGGAVLHTLFDLRIKPVLQAVREESDLP